MSLKPGQNLGHYVILEQIGKGGMATVFRASQPSLSRQVAIKVLPDFFSEDPAFHERFRQEAMAIAQLRHPNILTVFDSGESDGVAYIVTELVDGGTLAGKLGKPLPVEYCISMIAPVASALDYAHARGVVHRDVKPANILLARDGSPVLSDFGLARMAAPAGEDGATRLTATGLTLGTPEYMAPEQVTSSQVGPSADVYALAVTLYEMLTGSVPHSGDTPITLLMSRLNDPPPPPRSRNPELSEAVQDVLIKGLAKEPADRYGSAGEMLRALEAASRAPIAATGGPRGPRGGRRWLLPMVAVGIATAAGLLALASWPRVPPKPAPRSDAATSAASSPAAAPLRAAAASSTPAPAVARSQPPVIPPEGHRDAPRAHPAASAPDTGRPAGGVLPEGGRPTTAVSRGPALPPHGALLFSLGDHLAELAAAHQQHAEDTVVVKGSALELTSGTSSGVMVHLPVNGIADFVAALTFVAELQKPVLMLRFHRTGTTVAHVVQLSAWLTLSPPAANAPPAGAHGCCQDFDVYLAPVGSGPTLYTGPQPRSVAARPGEAHLAVVSVTGPLIVVYMDGLEIGRVSDGSLGPGGISVQMWPWRRQVPAALRLTGLDLYEATVER